MTGTDIKKNTVFREIVYGILREMPPDISVSLTSFDGRTIRAVKLVIDHDCILIKENAENIVELDRGAYGLRREIRYVRDRRRNVDSGRIRLIL